MYLNCTILLKIGKVTYEIDYTSRVQQVDDMAPILFLYVMRAAIKTLQSRLTCNKLNFKYFSIQKKKSKVQYGCLSLQPKPKTMKGTSFQVDNLLYIDDGAFLFERLKELATATQIIYDHFTKFGWQMHVGTKIQKSKAKAMFFPPSLLEVEGKKMCQPTTS